MKRFSMLPYNWLNRPVMVEAYSGEERSHTTDIEGISGVSHGWYADTWGDWLL
jgi:hypothetical protein